MTDDEYTTIGGDEQNAKLVQMYKVRIIHFDIHFSFSNVGLDSKRMLENILRLYLYLIDLIDGE